jgi:hypothetical protein
MTTVLILSIALPVTALVVITTLCIVWRRHRLEARSKIMSLETQTHMTEAELQKVRN